MSDRQQTLIIIGFCQHGNCEPMRATVRSWMAQYISTVKTPAKSTKQQTLKHVGSNLFRSSTSARYYAIFKVHGKKIRRSLKTKLKDLARRRKEDLRRKVSRLSTTDGRRPYADERSSARFHLFSLA